MGQSEEIEGPGSRIKEGLGRVVEREVLPFDHTDAAGDVTYSQHPSNVSHIADALRNSVQ